MTTEAGKRTLPTIREQLERWMVEEPISDGTYRKVPLMEYADRYAAEAVAAERARIAEGVRTMAGEQIVASRDGYYVHLSRTTTDAENAWLPRAAVLDIIEEKP